MSFLGQENVIRLRGLFRDHKQGGKFLLPIGVSVVSLSGAMLSRTRWDTPMITLTFKKEKEDRELYVTPKIFAPHKEWFIINYSSPQKCDERGIPLDMIKIKNLALHAFGYTMERRDPLIQGVVDQLQQFIKQDLKVMVKHEKELFIKDGEPMIHEKGHNSGKPIVLHRVRILDYGAVEDDLFPAPFNYFDLVQELSSEHQLIYNKYVL